MGTIRGFADTVLDTKLPGALIPARKQRKAQQQTKPLEFHGLPLELQEMIFEQAFLDMNTDGWDWLGQSSVGRGQLGLCPWEMRIPALARVNRRLRRHFLSRLFRTTTFRIDLDFYLDVKSFLSFVDRVNEQLIMHEGGKFELSRLRNLDDRGECGIQRLQLRLPDLDRHKRRANLDLLYLPKPDRWSMKLVVDEGFVNGALQSEVDVSEPRDWKVEMLKGFLRMHTRCRNRDIKGLDWAATARLLEIVSCWGNSFSLHFNYREIGETIVVSSEEPVEMESEASPSL